MKTNYEFKGNKVIKTMELNQEEIKKLKKIDYNQGIYIVEHDNKIYLQNLQDCGLIIEKYFNKYNVITKIGKDFLKQCNNPVDKTMDNKESINSNILQIPVKFKKGDTIYTIKKIQEEKPCLFCEKTGEINYNNVTITCPKCKGSGKIISDKTKNVVCDELYNITQTKINLNNNKTITVKYRGYCGTTKLNRTENNLFSTKEEAQKRCDELNNPRIYINISDIVISDSFKNSRPSTGKILKKLDYYNRYSKFDKDITLDSNNILIDGYINYLICQLLHIKTVKVIIKDIGIINKKENKINSSDDTDYSKDCWSCKHFDVDETEDNTYYVCEKRTKASESIQFPYEEKMECHEE